MLKTKLLAAVLLPLLLLVGVQGADAEDIDPRSPLYVTGNTSNPLPAGSRVFTATGIPLALRSDYGDSMAAQFRDWPTLRLLRVQAAARLLLQLVSFDFNQSKVRPDAAVILDDVAETLQRNPEVQLRLDGYTDLVGTTEYNLDLGQRRAEAVRTALMARGVVGERLTLFSYGKLHPAEDTPGPSEANRRVETEASFDLP